MKHSQITQTFLSLILSILFTISFNFDFIFALPFSSSSALSSDHHHPNNIKISPSSPQSFFTSRAPNSYSAYSHPQTPPQSSSPPLRFKDGYGYADGNGSERIQRQRVFRVANNKSNEESSRMMRIKLNIKRSYRRQSIPSSSPSSTIQIPDPSTPSPSPASSKNKTKTPPPCFPQDPLDIPNIQFGLGNESRSDELKKVLNEWWCPEMTTTSTREMEMEMEPGEEKEEEGEYGFMGFSYDVSGCQDLKRLTEDFITMRSNFSARYVRIYGSCDEDLYQSYDDYDPPLPVISNPLTNQPQPQPQQESPSPLLPRAPPSCSNSSSSSGPRPRRPPGGKFLNDLITAAERAKLGIYGMVWFGFDQDHHNGGGDGDGLWKKRRDDWIQVVKENPKAPFIIRNLSLGSELLFDNILSIDQLINIVNGIKMDLKKIGIDFIGIGSSEMIWGVLKQVNNNHGDDAGSDYGAGGNARIGKDVDVDNKLSNLFQSLDLIQINILPFFHNSGIIKMGNGSQVWDVINWGIEYFKKQIKMSDDGKGRARKGKVIRITETGWPSNEDVWKANSPIAVASIPSQQAYYDLLDHHCEDFKKDKVGWFAHIWSDDMLPGWGILNSNGQPKFPFNPRTSC